MKKEVRVCYDDLGGPQEITQNQRKIFWKHGLDMQRHECDIEDDHDRKERIIKIQPERKYFYSK